jgi:Kdo2-lipid IVA lauroyltransferase/acyltransferase
MGAFGFYLLYLFNWVFTLLPLPVLYIFSDLIFLIIYKFPSYRRNIVATNLRNSFPEKSEKELRSIERRYYRHLADLIIEILKMTHMDKDHLMRRMKMTNPELLERFYNEGRDISAVMGHYNNWEWLQSIIYYTEYQTVSIYKPINNQHFDKLMLALREKRGMILSPMSNIIRVILDARRNGRRCIYSFITDQTPPKPDIKYWTSFLNQETPVYLGVEKIARKYNMVVVFFHVQKIKRGYYTFTAEALCENTSGLPEYAITESHVRKLEELIRERPEFWIWSHRRWKNIRSQAS